MELLGEDLREEHERMASKDILSPLEFIRDVGPYQRKFDLLWTRVKTGAAP